MDVIVQGQPSIEIGFERKVVDSYKDVDSALSDTSQNPVTNAAITAEIRRQDSAIEAMSEANEAFKGEVSLSMESFKSSIEDGNDDFKEEVNTKIAKKANITGYYPLLHVGLSDNLPDRGDVTEGLLGFRESAGAGNSIEDGTANVIELCGESVVWNQGLKYALSQADYGKNGWWCRYGEAQLEGRKVTFTGVEGYVPFISQAANVVKGHVYLLSFDFSTEYVDYYKRAYHFSFSNNMYGTVVQSTYAPQDSLTSGHRVYLLTANDNYSYFIFRVSDVNLSSVPASTATLENYRLIDLTLMFGSGNEPTTVDEFYSRVNQLVGVDLYAYNEGEVLGVNIKGIKSVNDNAFNGEFAKVLGGREYCADGEITSIGFAREIDGTTEAIVLDSENKFTPSENGYVYASGTDICIHLVHTGYKDHVYTPHEESESSFDLTPYFPNGMHGIGDVRDSVTKNKAVRRFGVVDMGTLNWLYNSAYAVFIASIADKRVGVENIVCNKYNTQEWNANKDKSIVGNPNANQIQIFDSSYTNTASFKAAMQGVMLYYELATPIETEIDPQLNMNYKVWDFGTEELLADSKSAPALSRIIYGFNATDTIRGNKAKNEEQEARLHTLESEVVRKGDYSPSNTVGYADRLVGHGESVPAEFSFRASGGKSILDGAARVKELRGNGVVWNQQLRPLSSVYWYVNPDNASSEYSNNYCRLTIAQEESALPVNGVVITAGSNNQKTTIPNHAYLITADIRASVDISVGIRNFTSPWGGDYRKDAQANKWTRVAFIESRDDSYSGYTVVGTTTNIGLSVGDTIDICNVAAIDLTLMFGAGNEPTTVDEFYARKPIGVDESAYNEGTLIPFNADAIKSVGFNAWDGATEEAYVSDFSGYIVKSQNSLCTDFVRILPNNDYFIRTDATSGRWGAWYDANKQFVAGIGGGGIKTSPANALYMRMTIVYQNNGNPDTFCINLSHTGYRDGEYQPYEDFVREIDPRIKAAFPNGMKPWDKVYNKNGKGYIVKGSGEVDLGTLSYYIGGSVNGDARMASTTEIADIARIDAATIGKIVCSKYVANSANNVYMNTIGIAVLSTGGLSIYDPSYTDATSFKAAMAGVMLWYELAEPEIIEYDEPFNLDYEVADFGTEEIISEQPSAPINANIAYGFNAVDQIRNNADEIAQLKATIAELQAALASMVDNNVEE